MKTLLLLVLVGAALHAATPAAPDNMQLFLLIGQSNMAGRGAVEAADKVPHPRVFVLNKELAWTPAIDPLHWDKPERIGVGLASTFARVIADTKPEAKIGLIPAAFGGTSLDQWAIGGELYTNAVARAREAMKHGKLAGILWHQGESDAAADKLATYPERFVKMIAQLRADLGANEVPLVIGEIGRFHASGKEVNAVLTKLPGRVPLCVCVSAEGLGDQGDKVHFDTPAYREFGRRYAQAWTALSKRQ